MGFNKRTLLKVFKTPKTKGCVKAAEVPKGAPPLINFAVLAEEFLREHFNLADPHYGWWITDEDWKRLNPYGVRSQGHFHPSSGLMEGWSCDRAVVFDLQSKERSPTRIPGTLAKILNNGTNRHVGLHVLFLGMARLNFGGVARYEFETKLSHPSLPIQGTRDGKVTMESGHSYVLDFKTIGSSGFNKVKAKGPQEKHVVQLNTYMGLGDDDVGFIVYENKDNQRWSEIAPCVVYFDRDMYKQSEHYCRRIIKDHVEPDVLPEYLPSVCSNAIMFCNYEKVCKKALEGGT